MTNSSERHSPLILVADDDRFTRLMLRQLLEQDGYNVEEVGDGEQCLAAYTKYKPDMVLLDAMMPVMDGFTCCQNLRSLTKDDLPPVESLFASSLGTHVPSWIVSGLANVSLGYPPVLMITGLNDQASVEWAFESGATDFVTKPIHPPVLRQRVRRLLEATWAEKALRSSEKQYRSVVENVKEVIFQTDTLGNWTFLNPAWTTLTGFTVEESLGTNFLNYCHPDDQPLHRELWHSLVHNQEASRRYELRYITRSQQCRWIEIHAYTTVVEDGAVTGVSGILQDITERMSAKALEKEKVRLETEISERRRTEAIIRNALEREKELADLQSRIITTISHEFRTPLTTVQSSTDLLQNYGQNWTEEKKLKHFQRIEFCVDHMTQLLNDVILIGKAEAGQLKFAPTQVNLESLCREIVEELQLSLVSSKEGQNKALTICFSSQNADIFTNLDEKLLRTILTNLLSNAVKFSPHGGDICFEVMSQHEQVIFHIQDQGIGIPPDDQGRLFESFHRASNVGTIPGTGLGLAIAKKCVDLHQGQITLESQVGVGTTVRVTLPLNANPTS